MRPKRRKDMLNISCDQGKEMQRGSEGVVDIFWQKVGRSCQGSEFRVQRRRLPVDRSSLLRSRFFMGVERLHIAERCSAGLTARRAVVPGGAHLLLIHIPRKQKLPIRHPVVVLADVLVVEVVFERSGISREELVHAGDGILGKGGEGGIVGPT